MARYDWTFPAYKRSEVNRAGKVLLAVGSGHIHPEQLEYSYEVVDNWRAAHNYPLNTFQVLLRARAMGVDRRSVIAQRIKRLPSVIAKLARQPEAKLTQIQDIGGCRAVLPSVRGVYQVFDLYRKRQLDHYAVPPKDYIEEPTSAGYRSVHLVYKYFNDERPEYSNLKIEIQIRSALQHAWATAVETIGTFENQPLKWGQGDLLWLRFFALMGSAIALEERCDGRVPGTPKDDAELKNEIRLLHLQLNVTHRLRAYAATLTTTSKETKGAFWYLLELDIANRKVLIRGFPKSEVGKAEEIYMQRGRDLLNDTSKDLVLVSAGDMNHLKRAYPNYRADSDAFISVLTKILGRYEEAKGQ